MKIVTEEELQEWEKAPKTFTDLFAVDVEGETDSWGLSSLNDTPDIAQMLWATDAAYFVLSHNLMPVLVHTIRVQKRALKSAVKGRACDEKRYIHLLMEQAAAELERGAAK